MSNALNMEIGEQYFSGRFTFHVYGKKLCYIVLLHVSSLNAHVDVHNFAELYSNLLESVDKINIKVLRSAHIIPVQKKLYTTEYYTYTK